MPLIRLKDWKKWQLLGIDVRIDLILYLLVDIDNGLQYFRVNLEDREFAVSHMLNILLGFLKYQKSDSIRVLDHLISERKQRKFESIMSKIKEDEDESKEDIFDQIVPKLCAKVSMIKG